MAAALTIAPGLSDLEFFQALTELSSGLEVATSVMPSLGLEGWTRTRVAGSGEDYIQSRAYQSGDPIRWVDWNATARTTQLITKQFEASREIKLTLVVDRSASMCVGVLPSERCPAPWLPPRNKYSFAVQLAGAIALAGLRQALPVELVAPGEPAEWAPPSHSPERIFGWLARLRVYRPDQAIRLGPALVQSGRSGTGLIIVLSDLHDPSILPALRGLNRLHDCRLIWITDPAEVEGLDAGVVRVREAETARRFAAARHFEPTDLDGQELSLTRAGLPFLGWNVGAPSVDRLRLFFHGQALGRPGR
jgi:uncharacterized protein (DUF58 family)